MALLYDQFNRPITRADSAPPKSRTLYTPSIRDRYATYPRTGLTPSKLSRINREADAGYPARQVELFRDLAEVDGHLSSQLGTRKSAVKRLEFEIHPSAEDAKAERAAEFCRDVIDGLEDFDELLAYLLDAVPQGFALVELMWDVSSGQAVPAGFQDIPQERIVFDDKWIPRLTTDANPAQGEDIPAWQAVYHRHLARKASPVRAGVMRTCAWWSLFKNFSIRDWMAFAEVYGMPLRVGTYPSKMSEGDKDALKQALYDLGADGAAIISEGTKLDFVQVKSTGAGQAIYERLADYCGREMSKAVLGQTLTSDTGKVGSYGAAKVHDEVRQDLRDDDAKDLAKTIRKQILVPICLFNFGPDVPAPAFKFAIEEPEDLELKTKVFDAALEMGLDISKAHVYETLGIPQPEKGEEVLSRGQKVEVQANKSGGPVAVRINSGAGQSDPVQDSLDALGDKALAQAAEAVRGLSAPLLRAVESATDYQDAMAACLHTAPELDSTGLAEALLQAALVAELNGAYAADLDAGAMRTRTNSLRKLANSTRFLDKPVQPIEAIRFFRKKLPMKPEQFAALQGRAKAMAFTVAGVAEEDMLSEMFTGLRKSLRKGTTLRDFQGQAGALFEKAGFAGPAPWHLETVFRNQIQSAYSGGRYRQMSEMAGARPYWQYWAVMDKGTRPTHAAQHDKVYPANHPFWSTWFPPNGHRCRCDVVSLSESEVRDMGLEIETDSPELKPDPGWGHNPGEAGWGRGMVEAAFGGDEPRGGWQALPDLAAISTPRPPLPAPAPRPALPEHPDDLLRELGSEQAVRSHYRDEAVKRLGLEHGKDGKLLDLPITDAAGDPAVLTGSMPGYVTGKDQDFGRGRYLSLARDVVEQADEIWLQPGEYPSGKIKFRRQYIKLYEGRGDKPAGTQVVATYERRVWNGFNTYAIGTKIDRKRKGILIYRRGL